MTRSSEIPSDSGEKPVLGSIEGANPEGPASKGPASNVNTPCSSTGSSTSVQPPDFPRQDNEDRPASDTSRSSGGSTPDGPCRSSSRDEEAPEGPLPRTGDAVDWWLKQWGRDDVLAGIEPMSREDVKRLICANGGTAADLDLTFRNLNSANLSEMDLRGVCFKGADLGHTDFRESDLLRADFREADLFRSDLRGAFLMQVNLQGAFLLAVRIDEQTNLEGVDWGEKHISEWERMKLYHNARALYRQLNIWHQNHGYSDISGEFLFREWVCKRMEAQAQLTEGSSWRRPWRALRVFSLLWWRTLVYFLWLAVHEVLFGYGERPMRIIYTAASVVLGFAVLYFLYPVSELWAFSGSELLDRWWHSLYFSLVSFTTLGYGGWIEHPDNWLRYLGGVQSFIGLFITAMYLVTFTRKWTK